MAENGRMSISKLSEVTGFDRATISKRLAHITPFDGPKGAKEYEVTVAMSILYASTGGNADDEAKLRRALAEAEKAELQVARLRGTLGNVDDLTQAAGEVIKTLYQRIVRVMPQIAASKVVANADVIDIENIIRAEVAPIFDELRIKPENFLTVDESKEEDSEVEIDGDTASI